MGVVMKRTDSIYPVQLRSATECRGGASIGGRLRLDRGFVSLETRRAFPAGTRFLHTGVLQSKPRPECENCERGSRLERRCDSGGAQHPICREV